MPGQVARLDPIQGIINVAWASAAIITSFKFKFEYSSLSGFPAFPVTGLPAGAEDRDLFKSAFKYGKPPPAKIPDVINPISNPMLQNLYIWQFDTVYVEPHGEDKLCTGQALLFFNIGLLRSHYKRNITKISLLQLRTPAGSTQTFPVTNFWLWGSDFGATSLAENQAHPYSTGDPFFQPPTGIMVLPRAFPNEAARAKYLALNVSTWHSADENSVSTMNNNFYAEFEARSTGKKRNFNKNNTNDLSIENVKLEATPPNEKELAFVEGKIAEEKTPSKTITLELIFEGAKLNLTVQ